LEVYEIKLMDHRSFIIDKNMERYFNDQLSIWDKIEKRKLNPSRRSHRNNFTKMLEEELDQINIEDELFKVIGSKLSREIIERINKNMTYVLQTVRKKIKGPGRNVPFSKIKAKRRATYLY